MKGLTVTQDQAVYNIGAVERMTDIPSSTLRIWERRYDFPLPARSEGRHRLYTEKQVADLRWIKRQIDQGMRVGQAIRALEQTQARTSFPETPSAPYSEPSPGLAAIKKKLLHCLTENDLEQADQIFIRELAQYPVENQIFEVILPTLNGIGEAWQQDVLSVSTEHLATQYLRHRLASWALTSPPPRANVPPTILACAPGELHEGGLLAFSVLMQRRRWPVAYLGQSVPLDDLARFVQEIQPLALVLVAMGEQSARSLAKWPEALSGVVRDGRPFVGFGGRIFVEHPEWRARVPGIYLGDSLQVGLETFEKLLRDATSSLA
ncbi:MAG: MerR family transcriptional regulator [Anaerolineae bacterium]|nr:MerR family transcriptional regulator [Anaerolineae bacterium]